MVAIGYSLSSEEISPPDLVDNAVLAERAGFAFASISDHFHPWTDTQGESGFVWAVLGAIAARTSRMRIGTGVTCPISRIHPAIIAQASATTAALMAGRFFLGVGTGENLNEHITGARWPGVDERQEMLVEAIEIIRALWRGDQVSSRTRHFTVDRARIYSRPAAAPPIYAAAAGPESATLAGRHADGLISTAPVAEIVKAYTDAGGDGPRVGQLTVCWADDEETAVRTALRYWPTAAIHGEASQELPLPLHFEQLTTGVTREQISKTIVCSPDPERHRQAIDEFVAAGFDHVFVHQVGPDQSAFIDFYAREILPGYANRSDRVGSTAGAARSSASRS